MVTVHSNMLSSVSKLHSDDYEKLFCPLLVCMHAHENTYCENVSLENLILKQTVGPNEIHKS